MGIRAHARGNRARNRSDSLAGVSDVPPLVLAPIVPIYMTLKLRRRAKSLRASGLKFRRVLLAAARKWVLPAPPPMPTEQQLEKLAPREVLDSPQGAAIRRAAEDRAAILDIVDSLPKTDRALLPDIEPTVNALVERVAELAQMYQRLDQSIEPQLVEELDASHRGGRARDCFAGRRATAHLVAAPARDVRGTRPAARRARPAARQRGTGHRQSAARSDQASVVRGASRRFSDVSSATQEARALSREIDAVLGAAAEMRDL